MRAHLCLLTGLAFLLGGCGRLVDSVARLAESARTATEQLASNSDRSNQLREIRIDPDVRALRNPAPLRLSSRFETREGPGGYFVYDTERHSIARFDGRRQTGLTLDQARSAEGALGAAAAKGQLD